MLFSALRAWTGAKARLVHLLIRSLWRAIVAARTIAGGIPGDPAADDEQHLPRDQIVQQIFAQTHGAIMKEKIARSVAVPGVEVA